MKSQHICLKLFRGKKQKLHYVELVFGICQGFPHSSVGKESICNSGDPGLIPGLERSAGEEIGYPLQYSCLENPRDGGAWWAAIYGIAQSRTRLKRLSSSSLSLLQGIFPTQALNPGLPHCRQILHQLSHKGSQEYWSG